MPLFAPVLDTLRWDDLVRQGRAQLPLTAPDWTDQNTSDPGIAVLELIAWLIEADSYRSSAVTDRERRRLLAIAGFAPRSRRSSSCLVRFGMPAPGRVPAGLRLEGRRSGDAFPLMIDRDVAVSGAEIGAVAVAQAAAEADDYRSACTDETRERSAGRILRPFGSDPALGDALLIGLARPGGLAAGDADLWFTIPAGPLAPDLLPPETASTAPRHHSATTVWEAWDGSSWLAVVADDETAALTRGGRVRLTTPAIPVATLGDQTDGVLVDREFAWVRCRLAAGRLDAPPALSGVHVDVGEANAARPYESTLRVPAGSPVSGAPAPGIPFPTGVLALDVTADRRAVAVGFGLPPSGAERAPAVEILQWTPPSGAADGLLVVASAVLGRAAGTPGETMRLPEPWCDAEPKLWLAEQTGATAPIRIVPDLAEASPDEYAAELDPDGVTVRFGDGRRGRLIPPTATVLASGRRTTATGISELGPPAEVSLPRDARTTALLPAASATTAALVAALRTGSRQEDVSQIAARAEAALWVHDRITDEARRRGVRSLDALPLAVVRGLGIPERSVTALDFERRALATPGVSLWRARALPDVDPRLPGLRADGCITVVIVPTLPVDRPEPTRAAIARVRAELESTRTVGTRVFVVGPTYVRVGVRARLVLRPKVDPAAAVAAARTAMDRFLHPVTGGAGGRGWPFGRTVRRSEILQRLDEVAGVDRVEGLTLLRERAGSDGCQECGDVDLRPTDLVLAGALEFTTATSTEARR